MSGALSLRDVREGGRWSGAQQLKNDAIFVAATSAWWLCGRLPARALALLGRAVGAMGHAVLASERSRAIAHVRRALPELTKGQARALVRACFRQLGIALGETVAASRSPVALLTMSEGALATINSARAEGRGVILPSAHLGPWERVAATLVARGVPLVTLVRESYDPRLDVLLGGVRAAAGVRTIPRGSPHAAIRIVRALRAGDVLGAPMDLRSRVPSAPVPFLGLSAPTAIGPARIALRSRAPVVVCSLERTGGGLTITATRVHVRASDALDPALELTRVINDELSRRILTAPELWPWMHPRWDAHPAL